ncbi:MAG: hypothetical protein V1822_02125 [Candidatus Micrarchaeota archaeon]
MDISGWDAKVRARAPYAGLAVLVVLVLAGALGANLLGWVVPDMFNIQDFWTPVNNLSSVATADYSWIGMSYLALLVISLAGAIGYMMAGVLGPKVAAWCKSLMVNAVKSLILLTLASALFVGVENLPQNSLPVVGFFQINNAINFAQTVRNTLIFEFGTLTGITAVLSMLGNITPYLRPAGVIGISFSLAPAFRPIFDTLGIMLSSLAVAIGAWFVQLWLLVFFKTRLLAIFMPAGLFLRSFSMHRAGNVLIAIAIGFYFVFPFVLNINALALENYLSANLGGTSSLYEASDGTYFSSYQACVDHTNPGFGSASCFYHLSFEGAWKYLTNAVTGFGAGGLVIFALMTLLTGSFVSSFIFGFLVMFVLSILSTSLFYVIVVSILMPLFNIFITLAVIKEITKYLGTEIDLSAFEKIF